MASEYFEPDSDGEVFRPSYPGLEPAQRPYTMVSHGLPYQQACKKHVDGFLNASRVYIMASKSLSAQTQYLAKLEATLGEKHAGTWIGVKPHSPYDDLVEILRDIKAKQADCLVTLGGGSLTDGTKFIVYALENGVETVDGVIKMEQALANTGNAPRVSLVFIPTTLSGAEYTNLAGCTNPRNLMKVQFTHPGMYAKLVVLDPDLCRTTPDWVWRSSGVRAIDHCVETICATRVRPEIIMRTQRSLKKLIRSLLRYADNPDNLSVRLESQLACVDATICAVYSIILGASHGIGHNLGPLGVGHGETSCVLLPSVMKYNAPVNAESQEKILEILWSEEDIANVLKQHGLSRAESDLTNALRAIFDELGLPKSLKDVGVRRDKWHQLAENSLKDICCMMNPVPLTQREQVLEILEMCSGE
ncbi:hypothetical protein F5Y08DRAFT_306034 [Xylaria arbuscula]|nr:hypothetical protein F5Y08DRAFT_306034 [Xylaria arbuscula]